MKYARCFNKEDFGFVQSEVDQLLKDADLTKQAENIKKWYDGLQRFFLDFGSN